MIKNSNTLSKTTLRETGLIPNLNLKTVGIVARDYRVKFPNDYRDFSHALPSVLKFLDNEGCDSVLFSLFSIISRKRYVPITTSFNNLKNIKAVFIEEFKDGDTRESGRFIVYYKTQSGWKEYSFSQEFSTVTGMSRKEIDAFVKHKAPQRILGNCCVLLCGETNGVKYSKADKQIHDVYGLRDAIPNVVNFILNPIHDRMTRFEMKLKRKFLSIPNRSVISVWNKGKQDKNGKVKDGGNPPWTVFHNGEEIEIKKIPNEIGVDMGIFDRRKA